MLKASRALTSASVATVFLLLTIRMFELVNLYAVNVLFKDQWDFKDATLFERHCLLQMFRWQHGPHRQGLGAVLEAWLEPAIHWNSRYEAFGIAVILSSAALLAVFLKVRLFGRLDCTDVIIPLLFLTLVQWQVLFDAANPSHGPLPVLLSLLYCFAWTMNFGIRRYAAITVLNFLLIYTGFGVFMGLITPVALALEYSRSREKLTLACLLIAVLSMASFFVGYKFDPAVDCFSPRPQNPLHYALFAGFMLSTFIGIQPFHMLVPAILAGGILLFVFAVVSTTCIIRAWRNCSADNIVSSILLLYVLLFCFGTAYGRVCLGLAAAEGSRYMCYLSLGFFALYLASLGVVNRFERSIYITLVFALALLSSSKVRRSDREVIVALSSGRKVWVNCYLETHNLQNCDARAGFPIYKTPEPEKMQEKIYFLEKNHLNLFAGTARNY